MGERLEIRIEAAEKAAYDRAAQAAGLERSDWMRATLNAAAQELLNGRHGPVKRKRGAAGS